MIHYYLYIFQQEMYVEIICILFQLFQKFVSSQFYFSKINNAFIKTLSIQESIKLIRN